MMSSINAIGTILIVLGSIALSVGAFVLFLYIKMGFFKMEAWLAREEWKFIIGKI